MPSNTKDPTEGKVDVVLAFMRAYLGNSGGELSAELSQSWALSLSTERGWVPRVAVDEQMLQSSAQ